MLPCCPVGLWRDHVQASSYDLVAALAVSMKCVDLPIEIKPMQSKSKNFTIISFMVPSRQLPM